MAQKIKIKRIQFNNGTPDIILSIEEFYGNGGYQGVIKDFQLRISDIKKVKDDLMSVKDFHSLQPWEG